MNPGAVRLDAALRQEIDRLVATLPPLPPVVRYYDDFENEMRSIRLDANDYTISIKIDGQLALIDLNQIGPAKQVVRHVVLDWFAQLDPHTVKIYLYNVMSYVADAGSKSVLSLIAASPYDARAHWNTFVLPKATSAQSFSLRALLHSLCRLNIGQWTPAASSVVRSLKSPKVDTYRVVRAGDCFLPLDQQAMIVNHIDSACSRLAFAPLSLLDEELLDVCILIMSFQYAFRPGQIARVEAADVRLFSTGAVHVAVSIIKQKDNSKRIRITRKIKREWGPLFNELVKRREMGMVPMDADVPPRLLFGLTPQGVSRRIMELTEELTGEPWSATDLRHTAAQRLADGGISHVGLTEFMGHTSDRIANVYFDKSPAQAQRINEALAISPIYSNLAKVAKTKTIDKAMLLGLPPDQQIGAVPHGVPIAGIGAAHLGKASA